MTTHKPTDEQQAAIDFFSNGDDLVIQAGAGTGKTATLLMMADTTEKQGQYVAFNKALRWDQPVVTPYGWRQIGTLEVGSLVMGLDGKSHTVTKVIDQGIRPMNLVRFSDGTEVVADDDHLWQIDRTHTGNTTYVKSEVVTTTQIANFLSDNRRVRVPQPAALNLPKRELPIDPWLLGVLLGDGSLNYGRVWLTSEDEWIIDRVSELLPSGMSVKPVGDTISKNARTVSIVAERRGDANPILFALREIGSYGVACQEKSVPFDYLWADWNQRLALLQGLMDTDGCPGSVTPIFTTTSIALADAVVFLTQSLGGTATKRLMRTSTDKWAAAFQVTVRLPANLCPFQLPTKIERLQKRTHDRLMRRRIVSVKPLPADRATCISIDSPDHLFLTAGCIPTHNSIVTEAQSKFPPHVAANTAHSLAFRAVGKKYVHRLNSGRMRSQDIALRLGIDDFEVVVNDKPKPFAKGWMAGQVMRAVTNFCQSADLEPNERHFPYVPGIDAPDEKGKRTYTNNNYLRRYLMEYLEKAWTDLEDVDGQLPYKHEHYLKSWHRAGPVIPADFILFDEAQDANPVLLACVLAQKNAQKILVGDSNQQIYEFTGAVDALTKTGIDQSVFLTQSFRFGDAIAQQANKILGVLESPLRLRGLPSIDSKISPLNRPDCYLTRTNATAVRFMLEEIDKGRRPHLMGGGMDVKLFAEGARNLMRGEATQHPDLACFATWAQVEEYVEQDVQGDDLRLLVRLCNDFSPTVIIRMIENMPREDRADVLISTSHKAKGREWYSVKLGSDFPAPKEGQPTDPAELRLLYVAVTRASHILDPYSCPMLMDLNLSASVQQVTSQPTNGVDKTQLIVEAPKLPVAAPRVREAIDISSFVQGALFSL